MVNYIRLDNSVVLNFDGKTETIHREDSRYDKIIECIREDRLDDIPEIVDIAGRLNANGLDIRDGLVYLDDQPVPDSLSRHILAFNDEGLPFGILLKFWENLKQNPSFNARKMLFNFLEHNGHPLTPDGCFMAYRGVTEDFKDLHTKTFDNSVGSVCEMSREDVDDNPNNTCSYGLHVAAHSYANGFGDKMVEVKVNPADVVAVPTDYDGTKMRVCKFEVMNVCEKLLEGEVYSRTKDDDEILDFDDDCSECGSYLGDCTCDYGCGCLDCTECDDDDNEDDWI